MRRSYSTPLTDYREEDIIAVISATLGRYGAPKDASETGIGDDAAILNSSGGKNVMSIDTLSENQDFRLSWWQDPYQAAHDIGAKSAAVNLSDINAMGAHPYALLISLSLPGDLTIGWVESFYRGVVSVLDTLDDTTHCVVAGGDLGQTHDVVVSVVAVGKLIEEQSLLRSGTKPGDTVAIAGNLGRAAAGLAIMDSGRHARQKSRDHNAVAHHSTLDDSASQSSTLENFTSLDAIADNSIDVTPVAAESTTAEPAAAEPETETIGPTSAVQYPSSAAELSQTRLLEKVVAAQLSPQPPLDAGPRAVVAGATAGIDISDGLMKDLTRLAHASEVMIELDASALESEVLALEAAAQYAALPAAIDAKQRRRQAWSWVLHGGEDYALLATFPAQTQIPEGFSVIGTVRSAKTPETVEATASANQFHPGVQITGDADAADITGGWESFQ